ncbi:pyridoxamine 5'-phosphate oxidase family protein [Microterricola viridarii]|uniref:PPOX class probable F420-dependent enzyme, Rv3369 family n=1 Tax=Microterricola viridarii TaxID=412690 RepID=A0A1H1Y2U7_9MICO|nr:pyridoxamine 5'-phosphate oxidase family protein [Microterricola viridarii]SDT15760.1 PPOX class probable F420-dependent enzyme, Rv3369 family [Microterricola viridarii]
MTASTGQPAFTLDPADDVQARALARLQSEQIAWFTSIRRSGFPHAVPVWFLWWEGELLVLSEPQAVKVRNVRGNEKVLVHLEAGRGGEHLTVLRGTAAVSPEPTSGWIDRIGAEYAAKYGRGLAGLSLDMAGMAAQYSAVIRMTPTKLTAW